jgi:hypothetical protein
MATAQVYSGVSLSADDWQNPATSFRLLWLGRYRFSKGHRTTADIPEPLAESPITGRLADVRGDDVHLIADDAKVGPDVVLEAFGAVVCRDEKLLVYLDFQGREAVGGGSIVGEWPTGTVFIIGGTP